VDGLPYTLSLRVATTPAGVPHTLGWNVFGALGPVQTNIMLRAQAMDVEMLGVWSAPVTYAVNTLPPFQLADGFSVNGGFQLNVFGEIGQTYTLQASSDLRNWVSILTFACTNSPMVIVDPTAKNYNHRYYRLAQGTLLSPITLGFGSAQPLTSNGLSLMLQATMGPTYDIEASTDLSNWLAVTNIPGTNWPLYFTDPNASKYPWRFYRATTP
jgi:hypothetical protein